MTKPRDDQLPKISRPLLLGFQWFVARYLAKNFHTVALHRQALADVFHSDGISGTVATTVPHGGDHRATSIVVYANHASWWDPLAAIFLSQRLFSNWAMYAPIDALALQQYPMFGRMGFFGVQQHSPRGAAEFLQMADRILSRPATSLWITPEGRFADVRDTTADLMPGLAHLAWKLANRQHSQLGPQDGADAGAGTGAGDRDASEHRIWFIPLAVEYTFWEERQPELLMRFGQPLSSNAMQKHSKAEWNRVLTERLREAQAELARLSVARDAAQFEVLVGGRSGTFFVYDWWRKARGLLCRQRVQHQHGQKFNRY